jgi:hypothetical protein
MTDLKHLTQIATLFFFINLAVQNNTNIYTNVSKNNPYIFCYPFFLKESDANEKKK